ncbi:uncharacterized protein TNCV_3636551 [Trichonephila clavipes]|nr:uncharacterized protein TNCV_3636551 [Trichonephila clavipes]
MMGIDFYLLAFVLSKYAWAIPLHDKNAKTIVSAFERIFSERIPLKLQTDAGDGKLIARKIPQGCYESIPDILEGMYLEDFKNKIEFHYHPVVKRVNIKTKGHAKIFLVAGVSELLGFEPGEIKGKVESPYIVDPNASFPLICVYCDLVEPQIVWVIFNLPF